MLNKIFLLENAYSSKMITKLDNSQIINKHQPKIVFEVSYNWIIYLENVLFMKSFKIKTYLARLNDNMYNLFILISN